MKSGRAGWAEGGVERSEEKGRWGVGGGGRVRTGRGGPGGGVPAKARGVQRGGGALVGLSWAQGRG